MMKFNILLLLLKVISLLPGMIPALRIPQRQTIMEFERDCFKFLSKN